MQKPCGRKDMVDRKGMEEERKIISVAATEKMVERTWGKIRLESVGHAKPYRLHPKNTERPLKSSKQSG